MNSANSMPLTIRRYRPSDRDAVWNLHVRALEAVGARVQDAAIRGLDTDFADIDGVYLNSGGEFLVGLLGDAIVAMGALKRLSASIAEITRMRVDPQYWRRGYGEGILHHLESAAAALGYTELWLDTVSFEPAAQGLYRKNGFEEFIRVPIRGAETRDAILFRKVR